MSHILAWRAYYRETSSNGGEYRGLIHGLVVLVALFLAMYVVNWYLGYAGFGEPINKIVKVVFGLIILICALNLILGFADTAFIDW